MEEQADVDLMLIVDRFVDSVCEGVVEEGPELNDLQKMLLIRDVIFDVEAAMKQRRKQIEDNICEMMPKASVTVPGFGVITRSRDKGIHQLEDAEEKLIRDVLDTRVVDPDTGEIIDETPVEKLTSVWPHSIHGARKTELERRGLLVQDYAEVTYRGYKFAYKQREGGSR